MMRSTMGALLFLSACGTSVDLGNGGTDTARMLFIRQVNVPSGAGTSGGCTVAANPEGPSIGHGTLDVAVRQEYTARLVVGSQSQTRTDTSRVQIESVEVRLEDATGAVAWGPYTVAATGFVDPTADAGSAYGLVDGTLVGAAFGRDAALILQSDASRTGRHFTSISKVFGHTLGGEAVESGDFTFPITVCYGCQIFYPSEASDPRVTPSPNCDMPLATGVAIDLGCTPGQDEMVDCRLCKALYPSNPICEPQ